MKRWAGLCLLGMLIAMNAGAIEAVVSYTHFYLPGGGAPYIEVTWQANPGSLRFMKDDNGRFISKIKTDITLKAGDKVLAEDQYILQTIPAQSLEVAKLQNVNDLHRYMANFGKLTLEVMLTDVTDTTNIFSTIKEIEVDGPFETKTHYSGIQLLDTFYNSSEKSIYQKNEMYQLPLGTNFIDDYRTSLKYYVELYQSDLVSKNDAPLVQRTYISKNAQGVAIYKLLKTDTIQPGQVLPYLGSFNIDVLPSGNYYLNTTLVNNRHETIASQHIFLQRSNKNPVLITTDTSGSDSIEKVNILDLNNTFVGKFTLPQLKAILKMLQPISQPVENDNIKTFLKRPDLLYMQYFVYNFWSSRNKKDPKKAWEQYANKVRDINKLFGRRGYETDQGHIYLKYGKPTERVIVENESGSLPYEVWQYNEIDKMSNAIFLFYRPASSLSEMQLLHTNVQGELRNMNWRIQLYIPGTSDHSSARVEQYLYK
jgi:GWxTD domain-containing protein